MSPEVMAVRCASMRSTSRPCRSRIWTVSNDVSTRRIYGIPLEALDETGPSVVSINGVVASLAVTEFLVMTTGLREPNRLLSYRAERGIVNASQDAPRSGCPYCTQYRSARS